MSTILHRPEQFARGLAKLIVTVYEFADLRFGPLVDGGLCGSVIGETGLANQSARHQIISGWLPNRLSVGGDFFETRKRLGKLERIEEGRRNLIAPVLAEPHGRLSAQLARNRRAPAGAILKYFILS